MRTRWRSTCKWGGTAATVLLLVLWVGSAWWACTMSIPYVGSMNANGGCLILQWSNSPSFTPTAYTWSGPHKNILVFEYWFSHYQVATPAGETITWVHVPIWVIALLTALLTTSVWYSDLCGVPGLCVKCGYDLRGADHKVCPECGGETTRELKVES